MGPSRQAFSKPAPWVVSRRVKQRTLGFRAVQVLEFVTRHLEANGSSPSYRIIRDALGFADKADVLRVVKRLEQRGLVSIVKQSNDNWHASAIRLIGPGFS